jgi:regulator of cell morphogenesis and NO signaling
MKISEKETIGNIVAYNFRAADVFTKYGIDFCCGGNISVSDAAVKYNADCESVMKDLEVALTVKDIESDLLNKLSPDALIDHIIETHHSFVRENLEIIPVFLEKLAEVHGANHPELIEVNELFLGAKAALAEHLKDEEENLFPYVRQLVKASQTGSQIEKPDFSMAEVLDGMHDEHDAEGERFRTISALTNGFTVPADGCNTYRVGIEKLKVFETDLHRHIHLENNILFPKAVELEKNSVI